MSSRIRRNVGTLRSPASEVCISCISRASWCLSVSSSPGDVSALGDARSLAIALARTFDAELNVLPFDEGVGTFVRPASEVLTTCLCVMLVRSPFVEHVFDRRSRDVSPSGERAPSVTPHAHQTSWLCCLRTRASSTFVARIFDGACVGLRRRCRDVSPCAERRLDVAVVCDRRRWCVKGRVSSLCLVCAPRL
ncbi:hypothetical protein SCHPADRAFT_752357 [Schizopora paradoxa]|uniref:Uncharacterized protein n=1 Tax=Schizopora paradoxa TaxID=27342 RepID=A0A0H2R4X8_9AGAM|nr:hypothetical protein SCHPADRAFT_752357 [Schizopora paradoxa]